jgi:hypothetical protein
MYRDLHDSLSHAAELVRLRSVLQEQHTMLQSRHAAERDQLAALYEQLEKERSDVARLEGLTLSRLVATVEGSRDDRLAEERREALLAEQRHSDQALLVVTLESQIQEIARRIAELGDVDAIHRQAMETKGRMLMEQGDQHGRLVGGLVEQFSNTCAWDRELVEAIACGNRLTQVLEEAADHIERGLRRGYASTRHESLADASASMRSARVILESFHKELADVGRGLPSHLAFHVLATDVHPNRQERAIDERNSASYEGNFELVNQHWVKHTARGLEIVRAEVRGCMNDLHGALAEVHRVRQGLWDRLQGAIEVG